MSVSLAVEKTVEGEIASINNLIDARTAARTRKDFKESDRIRDELAAMGVELEDYKDRPTTWKLKR